MGLTKCQKGWCAEWNLGRPNQKEKRMKQLLFILYFSALQSTALAQAVSMDIEMDNESGVINGKTFVAAKLNHDRLFLQLPQHILEQALLWARIGPSNDYDTKQVVFTRSRDEIFLEERRIWSEIGTWIPLKGTKSVEKNILGIFPILETTSDGFQIDVTELLLGSSVAWPHGPDSPPIRDLSRILDIKNMGQEVMVKTNMALIRNGIGESQIVYHSFYDLPEPMEPRPYDYRMPFAMEDFGNINSGTRNFVGSLSRWRLEKKHKDQEPSVPLRPITFVMSPEIPLKWRPYVKAGIEEWLAPLESAGFKDAIRVKEVDTLTDWDRYGLGHSIVRWSVDSKNRMSKDPKGGSSVANVIDLRSGEILKSDILFRSSYESLMDEYFIRCASLDARAQAYPFPDDLLGRLIQSVVAHETGHTLGIKDCNIGEYSYPVGKMGDAFWLEKMGHTPSIMTYARHNNMAQPMEGVPPNLLIQKVGPTDHYFMRWAYTEFPEGMLPREKFDIMERMVRLQDSIPWYRFNNSQYEVIGPAATNEIVETDNPIQGATLGLKNLERAIDLLPKVLQDQTDYARLEQLYGKSLRLWYNTMLHVVSLIGGYEIYYKAAYQSESLYTPIPLEIQDNALDFLTAHAFDPPDWLISPESVDKTRFSTYPDQVLAYQQILVFNLLGPRRLKRLEHMETIDGFHGALKAYLQKFQKGLFMELDGEKINVERRKQGIQMAYIDYLSGAINQERMHYEASKIVSEHSDYARGIMMEQLLALELEIRKKMNKSKNLASLGHWNRCLDKLRDVCP